MLLFVQTADGKDARGLVASELAAMVSLKTLPDMLSFYDPADAAHFEQLCRAFAVQLQLPEQAYVDIHYPFFFSPDWDPRHYYVRSVMSTPRVCDAELQHMQRSWLMEDFPEIYPPRGALKRQCGGTPQLQYSAPSPADWAASQAALQQAVAQWEAEHGGVNYFKWRMWDAARSDPRLRTMLPEQYHPLVKVTPDLNSPAEHAVGTIKHAVRDMLLRHDLHDPRLWKGRVYREFVQQCLEERFAGVNGRHHVAGSVRKLPWIAAILAAPKGVPVHIPYVFGSAPGEPVREPGPEDVHVVKGTGGAWIRDTRWN